MHSLKLPSEELDDAVYDNDADGCDIWGYPLYDDDADDKASLKASSTK